MWSVNKAILIVMVICARSATVCSAESGLSKELAVKNLAQTGEQASVDSTEVAITSYSMDVNIFPQTHLLKVRATLELTSTEDGVAQLSFELCDQFKVKMITQADKALKFSQNNWNITVEGVQVGQNSQPLVWDYQGTFKPPFKSDSMEDIILYVDEIRLTYTSHWYPKPLWSFELAVKPSSRLSVEVPKGFVVVSGSRQQHSPFRHDGRVRYQYISSTHGSLSFAAARYAKTGIPWNDKTLEAYFFPKKPGEKPKLIVTKLPQEEKYILETLKTAKKILDFYSDKFGPYPWGRFALVQKSNYAAYAYGVQTYVVMNKLGYVNEKTLAHEISHQWWGSLIKPVGEGERWLTESLAEYSAFLYMEHAHGSKQVTDSREFLLTLMQDIHPIRKTSFSTPRYDNIVYKIGPHVFHMLRYIVGDEQFSLILKTFTKRYANKDATIDDFIEIAKRVHKEPLDWFFNQWLDMTRNPAFVLESESIKQGDNTFLVKGTITQHNTNYRMPLAIEVVGKGQKEKQHIWVKGSKVDFECRVPYKPAQVKFAEEMKFWVLADFFHSEEECLAAAEKRPKPRPSGSKKELLELIRNNIKLEQPYEPGTEIELELGEKEAVRLKLAENPRGVKEILICPMEGSLLFMRLYRDGGSSVGSKSLTRGEAFYYTRAANVAVWQVRDDKVHIKFRAETDREKIKEALREVYFKKKGITKEEIEKRLKQFFP